ncbi:hypothetical protein KFK09_022460 [Dendrobium nobile]|uniref:Uncharacterized protein n=1 Tax=Dendrobium nobile TaxID=94219 RepID=A0A8T3AIV0_DENNO|nr:hypothetical protein KFK09_022460 [Dendrobium nobile]
MHHDGLSELLNSMSLTRTLEDDAQKKKRILEQPPRCGSKLQNARGCKGLLHCARASLTFATPASSHHIRIRPLLPALTPRSALAQLTPLHATCRFFALVSFICKVAHPISLRKSITHRFCFCTILPSQQPCTIHLRCASDSRSRSLARMYGAVMKIIVMHHSENFLSDDTVLLPIYLSLKSLLVHAKKNQMMRAIGSTMMRTKFASFSNEDTSIDF